MRKRNGRNEWLPLAFTGSLLLCAIGLHATNWIYKARTANRVEEYQKAKVAMKKGLEQNYGEIGLNYQLSTSEMKRFAQMGEWNGVGSNPDSLLLSIKDAIDPKFIRGDSRSPFSDSTRKVWLNAASDSTGGPLQIKGKNYLELFRKADSLSGISEAARFVLFKASRGPQPDFITAVRNRFFAPRKNSALK